MQALYDKLIDLQAVVHKEWMAREQLKLSPPYQAIEERIAALNESIAAERAAQDAMLSEVPDSTSALDDAKSELFEAMRTDGRETYGKARMKYSNKSEVNKARLLNDLQGDLDLYITLSNVTQAALKEYVKSSGQKSLLSCIETVSTPVSIEFSS